MLFVDCLTSQQQASVSQGRICSDNFTCCHTEIEVADQTFYLTQSQYTETGPTSPSADPTSPGAWQGSHWSANFEVTGMTRPRKIPGASGIRTRDLPLWRRTPYHWAIEAVRFSKPVGDSLQHHADHRKPATVPFSVIILIFFYINSFIQRQTMMFTKFQKHRASTSWRLWCAQQKAIYTVLHQYDG